MHQLDKHYNNITHTHTHTHTDICIRKFAKDQLICKCSSSTIVLWF